MTDREVLLESGTTGIRAALLVGGRLESIEIDVIDRPSRVGAVTPAMSLRENKGMGPIASLSDGSEALLDGGTANPRAAGQAEPVQITREASGGKLATASRAVALSGPALIHLPFGEKISFSRRLVADSTREASLKAMLEGKPGGWIVRRTAAIAGTSDLSSECSSLVAEGATIRTEGAFAGPGAVRRLLADHSLPAPDRIFVSGRAAESAAQAWCESFAPSLLPRILRYSDARPLFDLRDIDEAIDALSMRRVTLPRAGSLVIEKTEALTAIDVNAGSETNALTANLAAADEIARQLRLRHIGGLIVIDFISLARPADGVRTVAALQEALANDAAQTHVLPMSRLGLVEMTRERRGPGLPI